MRTWRLVLALVLVPAAAAQKPGPTDTDAAWRLVEQAYDAVMAGPAFTFGFRAVFTGDVAGADTTLRWSGTATTYAEPPEGSFRYRLDYDGGEIDAEAMGPEAYYVRMPRTRRVYVDSTGEAAGDDGLRVLLRLHPTLNLGLSNLFNQAASVTGPVDAKASGRTCREIAYRLENGATFQICFDPATQMPARVQMDFGDEGTMEVTYTRPEPIAVPAPETFTLAPLGDYAYAPYDGENEPRLVVGQPAPDFTLPGPDGAPVRLSDYRGQTVLLDFWGTWCAPCVAALPAVARLADAHPDLVVLGLASYEADDVDPAAFARTRGARYPVLRATPDVLDRFQVRVFPTYYVVGPDGQVLFEGIHRDEDAVSVETRLGTFLTALSSLGGTR